MNIEHAIRNSLELARLAPSVHNSQPWLVDITGDKVRVSIDWSHAVSFGDPTKRQTYMSIGMFTETLIIALSTYGFRADKLKLAGDSASLQIVPLPSYTKDSEILSAIRTRTTDRSIYKKSTYSKAVLDSIRNAGNDIHARTWVVTEPETISRVARDTSKAIGMALSNPEFRSELSHLLVEPWSNKKRGISLRSLYIPMPIAVIEPFILRQGAALSLESKLEYKRWLSASGVVFITTPGDLQESWFDAGRKYMHVCLALEKAGICHATSAALVEASTFHEDVEDMLGTKQRLQAVIRFGAGAPKRSHSPRLDVDELITSH